MVPISYMRGGVRVKVAHIVGKLKAGGVESVVFSYLRAMDREGLEIDVLYDSDSTVDPPKDLIDSGIGFIKIPPYQSLFKYSKEIKRLCREKHYDIAHSHINSLSGFPLRAAKRGGVKHRIAHNHTTSSKADGKRDIVKRALRPFTKHYATDFAACSENSARWMFGDKEFEAGNVKIFNNAIDTEKFKFDSAARDEIRSRYSLGESFVLLHVGRFVTTKNHPFIINVFEELLKIEPDSKLLFVGDGDNFDEIKELVSSREISDRVVFCGVVFDAERYYSAADAFILPSFYEGLPVVAVEAEASGLPCFMSEHVTRECAVTPHVKFLPLSEGAAAWAKAVSDADDRDRISDNILMKNSKFNIELCAGDIRNYYFDILAK